MLLYPNCKINLGLNVLRRRSDGYHELETLFYPVNATEAIVIEPSDLFSFKVEGITIDGDLKDNLCVKAWNLISSRYELTPVSITLYKYLPMGAGLGGGSSDAAYVIKGINQLFDLGMAEVEMAEIAATIGSDAPFFIYNKPMLATGRGEVLEPIDFSLSGYHIRLIKPSFGISTKEAYSGITPSDENSLSVKQILELPIREWQGLLKNDFERHLFERYPELAQIKEDFIKQGAVYAAMSGSGSTIFGLFDNTPNPCFAKPGYWCWTGQLF